MRVKQLDIDFAAYKDGDIDAINIVNIRKMTTAHTHTEKVKNINNDPVCVCVEMKNVVPSNM